MSRILFVVALAIKFSQIDSLSIDLDCKLTSNNTKDCQFDNLTIITDDEVLHVSSDSVKNQSLDNVVCLQSGHYNNLTYLPLEIGKQFTALQTLSLTGSRIKFVKNENFKDMKKLTNLLLGSNRIEAIPDDAFSDLSNLEFLSLCGNQIKILSDKLLAKLNHLNHFRADANPITTLSEKVFSENSELEKISIRSGHLMTIKFDFRKLKKISLITFIYNPCTNATFAANHTTSIEHFQEDIKKTCSGEAEECSIKE